MPRAGLKERGIVELDLPARSPSLHSSPQKVKQVRALHCHCCWRERETGRKRESESARERDGPGNKAI